MAESPERSPFLLGPFTRRPVVLIALLFALGIGIHDLVPIHPQRYLVASAFVALFPELLIRWRRLASGFVCILIVLLGITVAQREHYLFSSSDIGQFASADPHITELEICLLDDPQISAGSPSEQRALPPKQITTGEVTRVKTVTGWSSATGELPIEIQQIVPSLMAGQTVRMLGMLQRPRPAMNPGEFDWAVYYRQQRIVANFTVTRANNVHILADRGAGPIGWLRNKIRHALAAGFTAEHSTEYALLDALLLGNRDPQLRDIQQEFEATGVGYQLSVSGLHIAILTAGVFWLCRWMLLPPRKTLIITTAFALLYATLSLPSHSGIRAAILSVAVAVAMCSGRSVDRAQLLSLAAILMLLWHPLDLYSAGFHLSFAVVIVFVLLLPSSREWTRSWRSPDDVARPITKRPSTFQKWRLWVVTWFVRCVQYSLLAWLATLPLVAYHFGQASGWSITGGLVLLPVVVAALFAGVLKILLTLFWARGSGLFATVAGWPVEWMQACVHQLAKLPGSSIPLPTPPIWLIVVYYALLLATLLPYRRRWVLRLMPVCGVAMILATGLLTTSPVAASTSLKMTLLSLGAGQCAVVELPGGSVALFDAGSTTVSDVAKKIVEPFLRAEGQSRVDEIFLSHGDFDHISAAGEIATDYAARQVFTSYHFVKNSADNVPDQILLDQLAKLNRSPIDIAEGDHRDLGDGAAVDVLWPPKTGDLNSNNAGLVLRLTYAGRSILFPADIQDPAFAGVLTHPSTLKSDVLIAPHHGSSEDLTPAFLAAVHPQMILSSNLGRLTSKQRRFEIMTGNIPLYRTPQCGAITVTIKSDGTLLLSTFVNGTEPHMN